MKKKIKLLLVGAMLILLSGCELQMEWIGPLLEAIAPEPSYEAVEGELNVWFLDVGQGDSEFILLPNGETLLIDAGESYAAPEIISFLDELNVEKLDYVIATHPHADHIGGMEEVLEQVEAECFYLPDQESDSETYQNLMEHLEEEEIPTETVSGGMRIAEKDGIVMDVLAPLQDNYSDVNDASVVLRLQYQEKSFLFTGDAQNESEEDMLLSGMDLSANVLKVGHHGSDTSTTRQFLRRVSPQYAVISCGEGNSYGHPKPVTLDTLMSFSVTVYRTDQDGTIHFSTDGRNSMQIETEKETAE